MVKKLVEEWLKINLIKFFETNELINHHHHGGRQNFSTVTAKATIESRVHKNYENNVITGILSVDLSSCFETIDHKILAKKLEFYGVRGMELKLLKSYLDNWHQFVEVDTFRSNTVKNCQ